MMDLEMPVTLVVKAPSQKVEDHTVECALGWTVKKLKTHLSQVYPNRPKEHQQKLIYSGQLLQDHLQLKDVLRKDLDVQEHTVHLVCAASYGEPNHGHPSTSSSKINTSSAYSTSSNSSQNSSPPQTPPASPTPHTDGLRHRGSVSDVTQAQAMFQQQLGANPMAMYYGMMGGMQYTPEQMMWIQQMYAQQMAHYMQMYQQGMPTTQPVIPATPAANQEGPANQNQAANQRANRPVNQMMNAGAGGAMFEDDDEEDMNRDWLDWMYTLSRFGILLAIVYFYSTFGRFVFVLTFFVFMYMYQAGWFRLNRRQRREPMQAEQNQQDQPAQQEQNQPEQDAAAQEDNRQGEESGDSEEPVVEAEPRPSVILVAWNFITTFFSSLVPQQPPPVNVN